MVCIWFVAFDTPAIVCHHSSVPSSLIYILLSISLIAWWKRSPWSSLTSPQLAGNRSRCKKCFLILMLPPRRWYASSMLCTTCAKFAAFLLPRKFYTSPTKPRQASTSSGFMECMKFSSCISFPMSGPSKIPALSFSRLSPGNEWKMYLKHSSSRAFNNCLKSPNFICRGASIILSLGTSGSFVTFCLQLWVFLEALNPF